VLLAVAIHSFTSFDVMSFSVFYIIPMGSIVLAQSHVWVIIWACLQATKSLSQSIYDWFVNSYFIVYKVFNTAIMSQRIWMKI